MLPSRKQEMALDDVRSILCDNLPWSPFDFIREISPGGDRVLHSNHLTRPLAECDNLRFVAEATGDQPLAVFAERLPWDSEFFGYNVAKLNGIFPVSAPFYRPTMDYTGAVHKLIEKAKQSDIRYLFAPVDPRDLALLRALGDCGFSLIETRALYHMPLGSYEHKERYAVRAATPDDIKSLSSAARVMVNPYDRFHADPFISAADADRLMTKWVKASIVEGFADITIVPDVSHPTAFCTVKYHQDKWPSWGLKLSQVVFTAVSPEFKGWFRKIMSEINYQLQAMGAEHAFYTTQVTNKAVIWVLESLGYHFGRAEHLFRIIL